MMKVHATCFKDEPIEIDATKEIEYEKLKRNLSDALNADNLLILAGSGASLAVVDSEGRSVLPSMSVLWSEAKKDTSFTEAASLAQYDTVNENIEALLSRCESAAEFLDTAKAEIVNGFLARTRRKICELCDVITDDTDLTSHETFLRKVARRSPRKTRTKIYTTNYDQCFERAASRSGFITVDGFSHVVPQKYDPVYFSYDFVRRDEETNATEFLPNVFHLLKIHGSVDWTRDDGGSIIRVSTPDNPLIIYPHDGKFKQSFELPYLDLIADFQRSLRKNSTTLLVCGFGFNDAHISNMIEAAIRTNGELKIVVANRTIDSNNPCLAHLAKLVSQSDARVMLIEAPFNDLTALLPYVMLSHSEEELHQERTRVVMVEGSVGNDQNN